MTLIDYYQSFLKISPPFAFFHFLKFLKLRWITQALAIQISWAVENGWIDDELRLLRPILLIQKPAPTDIMPSPKKPNSDRNDI